MNVPKIQYEHCARHLPGCMRMVSVVANTVRQSGVSPINSNVAVLFSSAFGTYEDQASMLEAMARYELAGQQTFVVGPGMRTAFQNTTLDGFTLADFHVPHDAFYIALPECDWKIWGGQTTGWHQVAGLYVYRTPDGTAFAIWGLPNEHSVNEGDDAHGWIRLSDRADRSIEEVLKETFERGMLPALGLTPPPALEASAVLDSIANAVRVAISLCMYLTCDAAEVTRETATERRAPLEAEIRRKKSPGKAKVIERRLAQLSTAAITRVGGRYERNLAKALCSLRGEVRKHIVRGFFNTFWTGQGRTVPKRKWVYPFVRGTAMPAYESRRYMLDEPETAEQS